MDLSVMTSIVSLLVSIFFLFSCLLEDRSRSQTEKVLFLIDDVLLCLRTFSMDCSLFSVNLELCLEWLLDMFWEEVFSLSNDPDESLWECLLSFL